MKEEENAISVCYHTRVLSAKNFYDRLKIERDFNPGSWFTSHSECAPVYVLYRERTSL